MLEEAIMSSPIHRHAKGVHAALMYAPPSAHEETRRCRNSLSHRRSNGRPGAEAMAMPARRSEALPYPQPHLGGRSIPVAFRSRQSAEFNPSGRSRCRSVPPSVFGALGSDHCVVSWHPGAEYHDAGAGGTADDSHPVPTGKRDRLL